MLCCISGFFFSGYVVDLEVFLSSTCYGKKHIITHNSLLKDIAKRQPCSKTGFYPLIVPSLTILLSCSSCPTNGITSCLFLALPYKPCSQTSLLKRLNGEAPDVRLPRRAPAAGEQPRTGTSFCLPSRQAQNPAVLHAWVFLGPLQSKNTTLLLSSSNAAECSRSIDS